MTSTTEPTVDVPDTPAELTGEPPATNVIEALRRVVRDLPAIGKEGTGPSSQGGYAYRGIEQITRHAAPLFAKHGLVMAPHAIVWRPTREVSIGGKPGTDESLLVTYRVYGPGGTDDFIEVQSPGIGRDNSDKGSNKAMTAAYKYALTQMLTVADTKDDGDAHSLEADPPRDDDGTTPATRAQMDNLRLRVRAMRERGLETSEVNDEGEVKVLGTWLLRRNTDGDLEPALTIVEAQDLERRLADEAAALADRLLDGLPAQQPAHVDPSQPSPPAAAPAPQPAAPTPQEPTQEATQAAAAAAATLALSEPVQGKGPNEGAGQLRGSKDDDEFATKAKTHVNRMDLSAVVQSLTDSGIEMPDPRPGAVRRVLADEVARRLRAAQAAEDGGEQ